MNAGTNSEAFTSFTSVSQLFFASRERYLRQRGVGAVAIPTGIISAGFVEQYQRKSSISDLKDADIQEIAEVFVDKRYAGKTVEEMEEAQQITIFLVLRDDFSVLPQKNTVLKLNDIIVIHTQEES